MPRYQISFVRPGDATTYTAGDVVCDASGTKEQLLSGEDITTGWIDSAKLSISNSNTTNATFELFFFSDDANIPALVDNAAFVMSPALEEDLLGYAAFTLITTGSSGSGVAWAHVKNLDIPFTQKISSGSAQGIYCVLTATGAYDPVGELTTVDITVFVLDDSV